MEIKMLAKSGMTRRHFIKSTIAAVGAAALPFGDLLAQVPAKYRRYSAESPEGQRALQSYAKGVEAMLKLSPDDPRNWFRNAFVHLMDCPHGNWWFYVWHRGYLGYFEQTIRNLSGDGNFAMPYWDWTAQAVKGTPRIPASMFDGVLTPRDQAYARYTLNLDVFTAFIQPTLLNYWGILNSAQIEQLNNRGYTDFYKMWNDVTGNGDPKNMAFATTERSRYLTRENPNLDKYTAVNVAPGMILGGLWPTDFYDPVPYDSFTSSKTSSHGTQPPGPDVFSTLEGFPHNKVHNYIGGYGAIDAPWGNMTNNLSPVDPIFFLHHSNMDRLWDVWTRKQQRLNLPYLPSGQDWDTFSKEPFLFYVDGSNGKGEYVGNATAGEYVSTTKFDYDYEPGFGEQVISAASPGLQAKHPLLQANAAVKHNAASATVPTNVIKAYLQAETTEELFAEVTLHRDANSGREFDVLIGAPSDVTEASADSPYYAGTLALFGHAANMTGESHDVTFVVPLPKTPRAFHNLTAAKEKLNIRVVPHGHAQKAPVLKAVSIEAR